MGFWPELIQNKNVKNREINGDMTDGLHLSGAGYQVWADAIRHLIP